MRHFSGLLYFIVCFHAAQLALANTPGAGISPPAKSSEPPAAVNQPGLTAPAEQSAAQKNRTLRELESGAITDQTITVAGQDFYQSFAFFWREKPLHERYSISVHERPSARLGNLVWVEYAQRKVFQATLPTNRTAVREMGDQAAAIAYQNVVDADVERLLFREKDLGPDEL